jgi:hypothetical protein
MGLPIQHVVSVRHVGGHELWLRFDDGVEGTVDLRDVVGELTGALAPLSDLSFVPKVFVNEFGTITWPGELDLDPIVLYCAVRGIPIPDFEKPRRHRRGAAKARPRSGRSAK